MENESLYPKHASVHVLQLQIWMIPKVLTKPFAITGYVTDAAGNRRYWPKLRELDLNQRPLGYEPNDLPS